MEYLWKFTVAESKIIVEAARVIAQFTGGEGREGGARLLLERTISQERCVSDACTIEKWD